MNCHAMNNTNIRNDDLVSVPLYDYCDDFVPKEGVLSFSFDHIYAITPDNLAFVQQPKEELEECSTNLDKLCSHQSQTKLEVESLKQQLRNTKTELRKLKKLASVHLDLIQRQSYLLTSKEKHNRALSLENEALRSLNNGQRQNPPPLISFPPKTGTATSSKSLVVPETSQTQHLKTRKQTSAETPQPSTSGYVYVKKQISTTNSRSETHKAEQNVKDPAFAHLSKTKVGFSATHASDGPSFDQTAELTPNAELDDADCDFDKTDFDIIYQSQSQDPLEGSSIYETVGDLEPIKIKEEVFDSDDIFDPTDNDIIPYQKVEKSCRDFSYGESLTNISPSVLSTLSDPKASTSHKIIPWWQQNTNMVSSDFINEIQTHYADNMSRRKGVTPKGKGKGKGKKSQPTETTVTSHDDTTNALIRNMFIAPDVPDIPEKTSPSLIEEPKAKNRFFRSKLVRDGTNNNNNINKNEEEPNAVYSFDSQNEQRKPKKEGYRSDMDIFDFCSQQETDPPLSDMPVETRRKKHIYDPPTKTDVTKEPKRATSPSASVYSFEDSQETKIPDKERTSSPDLKDSKHFKPSRAFGVFGSSVVTSAPFDAKKSRRKSTTAANTSRQMSKNSKARSRANSLYTPSIPTYQRDKFVTSGKKGRQRAQSTGSHTSAGSRSKSSCDVNLNKLNADLDLKNRCFTTMSQPEYDFLNVAKQPVPEATPINTLEVPKWRIKTLKPIKPSKSEQPEEKLDDIVFAKRHTKMELEEKRIKRWDYQRLKEQLHLKKLKERQEKLQPGMKKVLYRNFKQRRVIPPSLWPTPEDVLAIEVVDKLPVSSFGEPVPFYKPRVFVLPWLKKRRRNNSEKKSQTQQ